MRFLGFSLAYFLVLLDTTVLTIALPSLRADLGGTLAGQQWVVNAYTVAFAAALLTGGAVADRYGAARVFRLGVAGFGVLSLVSAFAPSIWGLAGLRALLGVAGALCLGGSLGLVAEMYPDAARRARAMGAWAAITGAALAAGPLVGGALVDAFGWRAIFLVNPPLALVSLVAVRGMTSPRGVRRIDWLVQALACASLGLLAQTLTGGAPLLLAVLVPVVVALVVAERRSAAPALPGGLLRATWRELLVGAAANFAFSGALFVLTLRLQGADALTPLQTGLAFLPLTLPMAVNPILTGRLVARYGARPPILGGLVLLAIGLTGVALTDVLAPWLVLMGLGLSFCFPALVAGMVTAAPAGTAGTAGGVLNASRQVGATLGVAVLAGATHPLLAAAALVAAAAVAFVTRRSTARTRAGAAAA